MTFAEGGKLQPVHFLRQGTLAYLCPPSVFFNQVESYRDRTAPGVWGLGATYVFQFLEPELVYALALTGTDMSVQSTTMQWNPAASNVDGCQDQPKTPPRRLCSYLLAPWTSRRTLQCLEPFATAEVCVWNTTSDAWRRAVTTCGVLLKYETLKEKGCHGFSSTKPLVF